MTSRASVAHSTEIPAGLTREQLREIYYYLRLTRSLEERLVNLYRQGKVIGGLYRSLGQEGESVASAYALQSGDVLSPLIRNLGSMLVQGGFRACRSGSAGCDVAQIHFDVFRYLLLARSLRQA